jgi:site-specific DNA-adenine methylase
MPYPGNKRSEYKYFKHIINTDYDIIIEPFCGSSAISFNLWKENGGKDKIYYLNDNDRILISFYNLIKSEEPEKILNELNKILTRIPDKETFRIEYKKKNKTIYEELFFKKYYCMSEGIYPSDRCKNNFKFNKEQLLFFQFIKSQNVIISNKEWIDIFEEYKNNEKALFMFDPPYLNSYNVSYKLNESYKVNINVYKYFYENNINDYKSHIVFILEDTWIIQLLFNANIKTTYDKSYSCGNLRNCNKRKTTHIIISN